MISEHAVPDFERDFAAAGEKLALCRKALSADQVLERLRTEL
jgi:hypothetical protein